MIWRWQQGRQGTGYRKLRLAQGRSWDAYLLHYPDGTNIPVHVDPVPNGRHFRVNVVLKKAGSGGEYVGASLFQLGRFVVFRPDVMPHSVTTVRGSRLVLSVGWVAV